MIPGAPNEARWLRSEPRQTLPIEVLERIVHAAIPGCRVLEAQALSDGYRNANFKLSLDSRSEPLVLRIYEHDRSLCRKEMDLIQLVGGSVPVPEVILAEPSGLDEVPPFLLMRFIDGISFRELRRSGDPEAIAQAAHAAGETLAAVGRFTFPRSGWLGPGPAVTAPLLEGDDPQPRFIDLCLASTHLQRRVPPDLRDRVHDLVWSSAPRLAGLDEDPRLVHGDFNHRNLLMRCCDNRWVTAAVLDWEFAVAGSPLADAGNFLRHASQIIELHFSTGYLEAGGALPPDWRFLARLADLTAVCEALTHEALPDAASAELVEALRVTVAPDRSAG